MAKTSVAIVGGGFAAMAAAWDLTSDENQPCDVTIFQMGGRLGGKGASSRNPDFGDRIEEHGLHLWLGYYENAFLMLRSCFKELQERPSADPDLKKYLDSKPFDTWEWLSAFERASLVGISDDSSGDWVPWVARFPEYVPKSENGVTGNYTLPDGTPLPGVHFVDDKKSAYPGEPTAGDSLESPDVAFFLTHAFRLLESFVDSLELRVEQRYMEEIRQNSGVVPPEDPQDLLSEAMNLNPLTHATAGTGASLDIRRVLQTIRLSYLVPAIQAFATIASITESPLPYNSDRFVAMLDRYIDKMRKRIERFVEEDIAVRRLWELIDLVSANIRGVIVAGLHGNDDFSKLDEWNYEDWLRLNRVADRTLRNPIVRGAYDLAMAYQDGDARKPQLAAGQALHAVSRFFFTYKGALFWRMKAGMGEVVFAPMYLALRGRGVKFRFFHRLDDIELDDAGKTVTRLSFWRQVKLAAGPNGHEQGTNYQPLELTEVNGKTIPSWPKKPDVDQFDYDPATKQQLREALSGNDENRYVNFESVWCNWEHGDRVYATVGPDDSQKPDPQSVGHYNNVVVTVPIAALRRVSRKLAEVDEKKNSAGPKWQNMLNNIGTVASQSMQLWVTKTTTELGWAYGRASFSAFVHPFDTWADLSQLVAVENQPDARGAHYFCSVLPETQLPQVMRRTELERAPVEHGPRADSRVGSAEVDEARETVKENARRFLDDWMFQLWPDAVHRYPNAFRWEVLVDPRPPHDPKRPPGPERLEAQHLVANIDPSDRYTQSLPGTTQYRIRPYETGFTHLFIAGDWTDCGLNLGCVEAAVISGRLASFGITGYPDTAQIPGYGPFVARTVTT